MSQNWSYIIDLTILSALLVISVFLKRKVGFFKKFPIPVPFIAGFFALILGKDVLHLIDFSSIRLENMVYHLMNIGFIALSLKASSKARGKEYVNSGLFIVSTYVVQGIVGFGLSLFLMSTLFPNLFPLSGLLLPLGFGQGPGQAYTMGHQWEELGFISGGNTGLTVAAIGYIWACIGGVPLTAYLIKVKKMRPAAEQRKSESHHDTIFDEDQVNELPLKESIDGLTLQLMLIGMVYLITYLTLLGAQSLLTPLGGFGQNLAKLLWGFSFIIGAVYGMFARRLLDLFKEKSMMKSEYTSNYLLERLAGASFDFMITAAVAAISLTLLKGYIIPILIITTIGGFLSIWYCIWIGKRIYPSETLENILAMYGMLTGTISTGIALLREVDPHFQTQAAKNLVLGSGTGLGFGFPLMILLNVPIMGYQNNNSMYYVITILAFIVYLAVLLFILFKNSRTEAQKLPK